MSTFALPLSDIVSYSIFVAAQNPVAPQYNVGCIIGPTAVIPAAQRTRTYTTLTQLLADGFTLSSPEYLAAQAYFSQLPAPLQLVVGRLDLTSIATWALSAGATGSGYTVNDLLAAVQSGGSASQFKVTAVNGSGAVTAATLVLQGTGYAVANNLATTGGTGTGALINITAVGDSALQAVSYCRIASSLWYACGVTSAVTADHQAIAAYVQASSPVATYFYTTADVAALNGTAGNVFSFMAAGGFTRIFGIYSTTQSGFAPNNIYSWAAAMGVAMGLNTGLAGSYFTMFGKTLTGVVTEPLTESQKTIILGNNGNVYLNFGGTYNLLTRGTTGVTNNYFDSTLFLDILTSAIQFACMNVLTNLPSVPQTDPGQSILLHAVNNACQASAAVGFIAPGVWSGPNILGLATGDSLVSGYLAQSPAFKTQAASDRAARKAMPIYLAINRAGAAQSLSIGIYLQ